MIIGLVIFLIVKAPKDLPIILSHWHQLIDNMEASSQQFYAEMESNLRERHLPDTKISRVTHAEGGMFSAKREYLRVTRKEHV